MQHLTDLRIDLLLVNLHLYLLQQLLVSINGVIQKPVAGTGQPSEGFSVDGTDIILGDAPATGSDFFILTFKSLGVSEPADNSVTSAKIVDGAIVNADINASAAISKSKIENLINNNADNRVITGSGTANTLNGESNVVIDSSGRLGLGTNSPDTLLHLNASSGSTLQRFQSSSYSSYIAQIQANDNVSNGSLAGELALRGQSGVSVSANNGTATHFRIDSSGNVGIGTTSNYDDSVLEVRKASGGDGVAIRVTNNTTTNGSQAGIIFTNSTGDFTSAAIAHQRNDNALIFYNGQSAGGGGFANATESMRIDSSGRLLAGSTSTANNGRIQGFIAHGTTAGESGITSVDTNSMAAGVGGEIAFYGKTSSSGYNYLGHVRGIKENGTDTNTACALTFHTRPTLTAPQERMRIDSSGNVLVGGTSLGAAGSFGMESNGHVRSILTSGTTGDTLFGAISGVSNGFQINISGTNSQMYRFHNGSSVTAQIDSDGLKFNNDTAAANALNDYEEGTWTPTVSLGFNNVQYETYGRQGGYTKIGRYVFITMTIHMGGTTATTTNPIQITGLPFTAKFFSHDNTQCGGLNIIYHDGFSSQTQGLIQDGTSRIDLVRFDGAGALTGTSVNAGREFRMAGSYMT